LDVLLLGLLFVPNLRIIAVVYLLVKVVALLLQKNQKITFQYNK
jgi:hypothetical protein